MPQSIRLGENALDAAIIEAAVDWLHLFYPGIRIELGPQSLLLNSDGLTEVQLELAWACATANAALFARAKDGRKRTLAELLQ